MDVIVEVITIGKEPNRKWKVQFAIGKSSFLLCPDFIEKEGGNVDGCVENANIMGGSLTKALEEIMNKSVTQDVSIYQRVEALPSE